MIQILKSKFEGQKLTKFLVKNIQLFFDYMENKCKIYRNVHSCWDIRIEIIVEFVFITNL